MPQLVKAVVCLVAGLVGYWLAITELANANLFLFLLSVIATSLFYDLLVGSLRATGRKSGDSVATRPAAKAPPHGGGDYSGNYEELMLELLPQPRRLREDGDWSWPARIAALVVPLILVATAKAILDSGMFAHPYQWNGWLYLFSMLALLAMLFSPVFTAFGIYWLLDDYIDTMIGLLGAGAYLFLAILIIFPLPWT